MSHGFAWREAMTRTVTATLPLLSVKGKGHSPLRCRSRHAAVMNPKLLSASEHDLLGYMTRTVITALSPSKTPRFSPAPESNQKPASSLQASATSSPLW